MSAPQPKNIRLKIPGESFWATQYQDLPPNQAEINNHLVSGKYRFGDRVEFDEDRNVTRLVMTRAEVAKEQGYGGPAKKLSPTEARARFGKLTGPGPACSYLEITDHEGTWVPKYDDTFNLTGYELREQGNG